MQRLNRAIVPTYSKDNKDIEQEKRLNMKKNSTPKKKSVYVKPQIEVISMETENSVMAGSFNAADDSLGGSFGRRSYGRSSYRRR